MEVFNFLIYLFRFLCVQKILLSKELTNEII